MTITDGDVRPLPTVLSLWGAASRLHDERADEADIVFFTPPTGDALTCRTRTRSDESGRVDRTVGHLDTVGRLVAEVFLSGPVCTDGGRGEGVPLIGELLRSVAERFEIADVRRVRMRLHEHSALTGSPNWSATVLQRYRTDHEHAEDVALVGTDAFGSVVARAWVTVAVES
ncbi:hypothetical protein [Rhodococcus sp. NPDC047139]|uniref:hypothetical protein n=1 Tax=Rhodococcus sp. NPDC047139 TaxID=3155141 RepID=UPI0033CE9B9D